jgi:hypothetical protein
MEKFIFLRELEEYVSRGLTPLHMPGHKRRLRARAPACPPGIGPSPRCPAPTICTTQDRHSPAAAMARTAALFRREARTWYLVNGSTCRPARGRMRALAPAGGTRDRRPQLPQIGVPRHRAGQSFPFALAAAPAGGVVRDFWRVSAVVPPADGRAGARTNAPGRSLCHR